jgi:DNA polymerase-3 subunit delta
MAPRHPSPSVFLLYGNQPYEIDRRAARILDAVLGPGERDFTYRRFDAEDLVKPGAGEAAAREIEAFEVACLSLPLLGERYVVRLDRVERLKAPARATQTLARRLAELRVVPTLWEGMQAWELEEAAGAAAGQPVPLERWVMVVETGANGEARLVLDEDRDAQFLVAQRGTRHLMGLRPFLRSVLKGNFTIAGDEEGEGDAPPPSGAGGARVLEFLGRMMGDPPPGLTLVLTASVSRDRDLARALLDQAKKQGAVEKFVTYDDDLPVAFVAEAARERRLELNRAAALALIRAAGNDHGRLAAELDKLALLFPAGSRLDAPQLAAALHADAHGSVFQINDRLSQRDLAGALAVLQGFLDESPNEFPVLIGVLARHFRQLLLVHAHSRHGVSDVDLASRLGVHPFIAKRIGEQAERFTAIELERILRALAGLDLAARVRGSAAPLFREFVQAVCRGEWQRGEPRLASL